VAAVESDMRRRLQLAARGLSCTAADAAPDARPTRRRSDQRVDVGVELSSMSRSPRGSALATC